MDFRSDASPLSEVRTRLRGYLRYAALSALGSFALRTKQPSLRLLFCHNVFENQEEQFRKILMKLKTQGEFVNTDICVSMVKGERPIDAQYFHLSFDDGFKNIIQNALPVLEELDIPAIIFVPSSFMSKGEEQSKQNGSGIGRRTEVIELSNWSDLRDAISRGFLIGSHSRSHSRLSSLTTIDKLQDEIVSSKLDIEDALGVECNYFAWPFGRHSDINPQAHDLIRQSGYFACFGGFRGSIYPGVQSDLFTLPRHQFEVDWPMTHIRFFAYGNWEGQK